MRGMRHEDLPWEIFGGAVHGGTVGEIHAQLMGHTTKHEARIANAVRPRDEQVVGAIGGYGISVERRRTHEVDEAIAVLDAPERRRHPSLGQKADLPSFIGEDV